MKALEHRLDPRYRRALEEFFLEQLEASLDTVLAIDRGGRIVYVNPAYLSFARNNGGKTLVENFALGTIWLSGVSGPLRDYYQERVARVTLDSGPWEHDYECSSPDTLRVFRLHVYPMAEQAKLLVHSLRIERPHSPPDAPEREPPSYRDAYEIITMCSVCRRTERPESRGTWDWVPALLEPGTHRVSHGLCTPCQGYYWRKSGLW